MILSVRERFLRANLKKRRDHQSLYSFKRKREGKREARKREREGKRRHKGKRYFSERSLSRCSVCESEIKGK